MKGIVQCQKITDVKVALSRESRKNMTKAEKAFWHLVRNREICNLKFRRQQIIDGLIVDFFCSEARLIIEIDGPIHKKKEKIEIDRQRSEIFKRRGLEELRFTNDEVLHDPEGVQRAIKEAVSTLSLPPPSPIRRGGQGGVRSDKFRRGRPDKNFVAFRINT